GPRLWFNLHFGDRFSLENTYSWSTSAIGYDATQPDGSTTRVEGALDMRQLTGGVRVDLIALGSDQVNLYTRGGYGWLWYRASQPTWNGAPVNTAAVTRGH